jgi:hypothetical protein
MPTLSITLQRYALVTTAPPRDKEETG